MDKVTVFLLYITGLVFIIIAYFGRKTKIKDNESTPFIQEIQGINFNQEFEKYQIQLSQLEALDVEKLMNLTESLEHLVNNLNEHSHKIMTSTSHVNSEQTMVEPEVVGPKNLMIRPEIEEKMKKYYQLKEEGMPLDQILKIIDMEKGELLFLENLYKSIT